MTDSTRIGIVGIGGRMGQALVRAVQDAGAAAALAGGIERAGSPLLGQDPALLAGFPASALCTMLVDEGIPAVALHDSSARTSLPAVQHNNFGAMRELVAGLVKLGHREILFAATSRRYTTIEHRVQGYFTALEEHGIDVRLEWLLDGLDDGMPGGREAVARWAELPQQPSAIVFANDWMAIGALFELNRLGIRVPEEVSIAGAGNYRQSQFTSPPLTTLATPWHDTIALALEILEERISLTRNNSRISESLVEAVVMWRGSTGPVRHQQTQGARFP